MLIAVSLEVAQAVTRQPYRGVARALINGQPALVQANVWVDQNGPGHTLRTEIVTDVNDARFGGVATADAELQSRINALDWQPR